MKRECVGPTCTGSSLLLAAAGCWLPLPGPLASCFLLHLSMVLHLLMLRASVLPESSRRLWDVHSRTGFTSLEFHCFLNLGFVCSLCSTAGRQGLRGRCRKGLGAEALGVQTEPASGSKALCARRVARLCPLAGRGPPGFCREHSPAQTRLFPSFEGRGILSCARRQPSKVAKLTADLLSHAAWGCSLILSAFVSE